MLRPLIRPMKTGDTAERLEVRRRSEELKRIAEDTIDEDCRVVLLRLAQSYERMAEAGAVAPPVAASRGESPWPFKRRGSNVALLPR